MTNHAATFESLVIENHGLNIEVNPILSTVFFKLVPKHANAGFIDAFIVCEWEKQSTFKTKNGTDEEFNFSALQITENCIARIKSWSDVWASKDMVFALTDDQKSVVNAVLIEHFEDAQFYAIAEGVA